MYPVIPIAHLAAAGRRAAPPDVFGMRRDGWVRLPTSEVFSSQARQLEHPFWP